MKSSHKDANFIPLDIDWETLIKLSKIMRYNKLDKSIVIEVGLSTIFIREDGTIKLSCSNFEIDAIEDIDLRSGCINLN